MATERVNVVVSVQDNFSRGFGKVAANIVAINQAVQLLQLSLQPFIALGKQILETGDAFDRLRISLDTLTGNSRDTAKAFQFLRKQIRVLPFDLKTLAKSFQQLSAVGGGINVERTMLAIADAVGAFGGSSQDFQLASLAFQQMLGKGVVSMEELRRQLGERIPQARSKLLCPINSGIQRLHIFFKSNINLSKFNSFLPLFLYKFFKFFPEPLHLLYLFFC